MKFCVMTIGYASTLQCQEIDMARLRAHHLHQVISLLSTRTKLTHAHRHIILQQHINVPLGLRHMLLYPVASMPLFSRGIDKTINQHEHAKPKKGDYRRTTA